MPDTILVVVEQREGKLNRVSWETITAGQAIAAATGWTLEAAVVGGPASTLAAEVAAKKVAKVYAVESPKLEPYTPDAFAAALKQLLTAKQPKLVLMPHTYQVRDFVPKLATAMGRAVISDCIGFKHENGKLLFHPPDVSGQARRRRQLHLRCAMVCHFPERSFSRRQGRSRRQPGPG